MAVHSGDQPARLRLIRFFTETHRYTANDRTENWIGCVDKRSIPSLSVGRSSDYLAATRIDQSDLRSL